MQKNNILIACCLTSTDLQQSHYFYILYSFANVDQSCSNLPLHLLLAWPTAVAAENLRGFDMARFISTPAKNRKQILLEEIHYPA